MLTRSLKISLYRRFDLRHDQAEVREIDATFRGGVEFRGTNLWVLIFAIVIASIGLNVNSTAVVIGAMLISPLMGPIMALGYGAGINDSALMRSSLFNLGLAALISLLASTAYFLVTPLTQAHSELLARTTPSIWDVLIALFGGLAGVIGATRRVKSNLIPGVAIATALMPPLCTAGYGLATGNLTYFWGAFYLFSINSVFIAIATLMMVRFMRLPSVKVLHENSVLKRRTVIGLVVLLTMIPSVFLAVNLVRQEWFDANTVRFVREVLRTKPNLLVVSQEPDFAAGSLRVNLLGDRLGAEDIKAVEARLPDFDLANVKLNLIQSGQVLPDMNLVKKDLLNEFLQTNRTDIAQRDAQIAALERQLSAASSRDNTQQLSQKLLQEISQQFPQALRISVSQGFRSVAKAKMSLAPASGALLGVVPPERKTLVVQLELPSAVTEPEQLRLRQGWRVRMGLAEVADVQLQIKVVAPVPTSKVMKKRRKK